VTPYKDSSQQVSSKRHLSREAARRNRWRAADQKFVEAIVGPEIDQTDEDIGEPRLWVNAV
jgi:hypothetical protein